MSDREEEHLLTAFPVQKYDESSGRKRTEQRLHQSHLGNEYMPLIFKLFKEIYGHRDILYFLTLKDIKIRYKFSSLGFLWAIIQPLGQMIILSIVFTFVVRFKIKAYPAFLLIGLLPWSFFSISINFTTNTFWDHANLIKKVYFPRVLIPMAQILSNIFDYGVSLLILIPFMLFFHIHFSPLIALLPFVLLIQFVLTFSISLLLSTLNVHFRDIKYLKDLILMFGFYASPVFYPVSFVKENMNTIIYILYHINPMVGIIKMYRDIFYYHSTPNIILSIYTIFITWILLLMGLAVFYRYEQSFTDLV